ncbi:MAG: T9SS type A sorting domain-containing protein [Flavobacteriales bacterium]|nr:T9SS type A sorting domain-containing protein [Flavobacteriales bacterium]
MKKNVLLALFLGLISLGLKAQSIVLVDPLTCVLGNTENPDDFEIDTHWDVINTSNTDKIIRVRRQVLSEVSGSRNKFCWGPLCYNWDTEESPTNENLLVTIPGGATNSTFSCYYQHQNYPGQTTVKYCFFDHNYPADETCVDINFAVDVDCVVGIQEYNRSSQLELSGPNPVVGTTNLTFAHSGQSARFEVINLLGAVVKSATLQNQQGIVFINSEDFENGNYVCNLIVDGAVHSSVRIVIAK